MISFNGLVKKYHEKIVLNNVSLELPDNKLIAFIGSNGAGKSTLISIISRILPQDEGRVYIENKEIGLWKNKDLAKKISILKKNQVLKSSGDLCLLL